MHEQHPLNLSDHLPISISLNLQMAASCEPAYIQPRLRHDLCADMKHKKRAVKQYVNACRARHEHKRLQQRDTMLRNNESGCFHVPKKRSTRHKLQADGVTATNGTDLLQVWLSHFDSLVNLKQMTIPQ